jgi:hypothetical protein
VSAVQIFISVLKSESSPYSPDISSALIGPRLLFIAARMEEKIFSSLKKEFSEGTGVLKKSSAHFQQNGITNSARFHQPFSDHLL